MKEKILNFLDNSWLVKAQNWLTKNVAYDKAVHFVVGGFIALIGNMMHPEFAGFWIGLILASVAGAAKEIVWDKIYKKGTPDVWDAVATAGGGLFTSIFYQFLQ